MSKKLNTPYTSLLPALSTEEQESLRLSIKADGVRDPIIIDEVGNILDGHHRYKFCPTAATRTIRGLTDAEKQAFVLQANFARRNLSPEQKKEVQKSMIAVAKALRTEDPKRNTQAEIAVKLGVTQQAVSKWLGKSGHNTTRCDMSTPDAKVKVPPKERPKLAKRVAKGESIEQVAADYGITPRHARRIVTAENKEKQKKEERKKLLKELGTETIGIHHGDFRKITGKLIADNSIDLILTDPPYNKESVSLYGNLAKLAARVLKPGSWCLAYAGHSFLVEVINLMGEYLEWGWPFAVGHTGGDSRFRKHKIQVGWKPIVGYYKPPLSVWWDWFPDVVSGGREKADHKWQQPVVEAEHFIKNLTLKNAVVLDPMCGSGTVCLAAKNLGRQWIGIDIDRHCVETARSRIA